MENEVVEEKVEEKVEVLTEEELYKANAFTPQEAAAELGGKKTGWDGKRLRRFIRDGTCPARKIGGRWFVTIEDLETLLETLEARAKAKAEKEAAEVQAVAEVEAQAGDPLG